MEKDSLLYQAPFSEEVEALHKPVIKIHPPGKNPSLKLRELAAYADLIWILIVREIKIRYKQTLVGSAWAILQPLLTMIIFTVLFGRLAKLPSDGIPYPLFCFCALVPWTYFTHALTKITNCLVHNEPLVTKIYFPRLILPLAAVLGALVDFAIAFIFLVILLFYYNVVPGKAVWLLPLFIGFAILTVLAVGLWLSALNIKYRDVANALPFAVQIWLFLTPIAYSVSLIPEEWQMLYSLNPMVGVVEGFRWALLDKAEMPGISMLISFNAVMVLLIGGLYFFKKREDYFADVI